MLPVGRPVRSLLRLEGAAVAVAGLLVWAGLDGGWWKFALLFLVPDLSMAGYLWGSRVGAAVYNAAHSYALPLMLSLAGGMLDHRALMLTGAIWIAHIGFDRALGYGLKFASGFRDTHLGPVGREPLPNAVMRTGEHLAYLLATTEREETMVNPRAASASVQPTH